MEMMVVGLNFWVGFSVWNEEEDEVGREEGEGFEFLGWVSVWNEEEDEVGREEGEVV